jgi:Na+/H+-dicarboxylate symporter
MFGVDLGLGALITFMGAMILLSFTTAGTPRGGSSFRYLPFYIAAGVPAEGFVIMVAAKTIPGLFLTILNSTAYMSVATLLTRRHRS